MVNLDNQRPLVHLFGLNARSLFSMECFHTVICAITCKSFRKRSHVRWSLLLLDRPVQLWLKSTDPKIVETWDKIFMCSISVLHICAFHTIAKLLWVTKAANFSEFFSLFLILELSWWTLTYTNLNHIEHLRDELKLKLQIGFSYLSNYEHVVWHGEMQNSTERGLPVTSWTSQTHSRSLPR